ncbi:MAG: hypothetical protein JSS89_06875 [Bacteroidetes bacterium]|nr:hypothetical protein [Bacteroidota bacterium]
MKRLSLGQILSVTYLVTIVLSGSVKGQSTETFNSIRFEDPSSIGSFITLNPPSGISPYALTLPSSLSAGTWVMRFNGATGTATWGQLFSTVGSDKQIAFFKGTDSLKSSSSFTYDDAAVQLVLSNTGTLTATDTVFRLINSATSSTASVGKVGLHISSTGTLSGTGTTNVGLIVDAQGAATNYAALFTSGSVGIGTSTPNTMLDVVEDVAYRELNYTTTLSATSNDLEFNTGNKASYVRIGTQTGAFTINGLGGGYTGKILTIYNASGKTMILKHESTGSAAANRIVNSTTSSLYIDDKGSVTLVYSGTDSRWIVTATMGALGMTPTQTTKTVTTTDKTLPSSDNNYIRVTNNSGTITPTFEDGSYIGQILVIQNDGPNSLTILDTTNVEINGGTVTLGAKDVVTLVWNGTKWYQIAAESNN